MSAMIECRDLWKSYRRRPYMGLKTLLVGRQTVHDSRFSREWVLRGVSFEVSRGRGFGIMGHNGTGKTTLLSILLGTLRPDRGSCAVRGRVASLIELAAGFHHELTGRENIFLHGAILGMRLGEIRRRLEAIVRFSELEDALDAPIRTYSAGMQTRLGFSIIANTPADVLLIDEVLAVGDARFQDKCRDFLEGFKARGGTLVIVSHNLPALQGLCEEGLCLELGQVAALGPIDQVIAEYRRLIVKGMAHPQEAAPVQAVVR